MTVDDWSAIVSVIASTRDWRAGAPVEAIVRKTTMYGDGDGMYRVSAREIDGTFRARGVHADFSYNMRTQIERHTPHETGTERVKRWLWISPPCVVLAMFAPAELPIWGGRYDTHRIVGAEWLAADRVRLDLVRRESPSDQPVTGYAVVDLANAVVMEMEMDGAAWTVEAARLVEVGGTHTKDDGPVTLPPGWPDSFAPSEQQWSI